MDLPYVENSILHIENSCFPLKNFRFEALMELCHGNSLKVTLLEGHKIVGFEAPNSFGDLKAFFLYEEMKFNEASEDEDESFDFAGLQFAEMHFLLYQPLPLEALMKKQREIQLLESDGKQLAAFNQCYLAEIENGLVKCLWFINPELVKRGDDPLYKMLREIFK